MSPATRAICLVQIVYASASARNLTDVELDELADEYARENAGAGLTGLLLHQGGSFYGVLEGPEHRVLARMETIISDPRQKGIRVLNEAAISARRFEDWSFTPLPAHQEIPRSTEDFIMNLARRLR